MIHTFRFLSEAEGSTKTVVFNSLPQVVAPPLPPQKDFSLAMAAILSNHHLVTDKSNNVFEQFNTIFKVLRVTVRVAPNEDQYPACTDVLKPWCCFSLTC